MIDRSIAIGARWWSKGIAEQHLHFTTTLAGWMHVHLGAWVLTRSEEREVERETASDEREVFSAAFTQARLVPVGTTSANSSCRDDEHV